ncbi:MAG TPA: NAD(P)-binding protein, partial [Acidimicrobiia bacterium]|nr:NAD(P)-binding protein [Acidimicrobiia bacterium]
MATKNKYDAIVIGGGHNGLVNGSYLAKAGLKTLILERRNLVGGAAMTMASYLFLVAMFKYDAIV